MILATSGQADVHAACRAGDGLVFANGSRGAHGRVSGGAAAAKRNDPEFFIITELKPASGYNVEKAKLVLDVMQIYCKTAAVIAWTYLALRFLAGGDFESLARTITYFSFFTMLSNILAAVALSISALRPAKTVWLTQPIALTGISLYMSITGLSCLHPATWASGGWLFVSDSGLHQVMPIIFFGFWLIYVPKGTLALRHLPLWLIFPALYAIYTQLHWSPYPFLDAEQVGRVQVAGNMALMLFNFLMLGSVFLVIDHRLGRQEPVASAAG